MWDETILPSGSHLFSMETQEASFLSWKCETLDGIVPSHILDHDCKCKLWMLTNKLGCGHRNYKIYKFIKKDLDEIEDKRKLWWNQKLNYDVFIAVVCLTLTVILLIMSVTDTCICKITFHCFISIIIHWNN